MKSKNQLKREAKKAKRLAAKKRAEDRKKVWIGDKGSIRIGDDVYYVEGSEAHLHSLGISRSSWNER
jgi:hypothetical protein